MQGRGPMHYVKDLAQSKLSCCD